MGLPAYARTNPFLAAFVGPHACGGHPGAAIRNGTVGTAPGRVFVANFRITCYLAKPASGAPRHGKRTGVHTANQLGTLVVGTIKESALCIPSLVP
jgi:hypothetical protein